MRFEQCTLIKKSEAVKYNIYLHLYINFVIYIHVQTSFIFIVRFLCSAFTA